MKKMKKALACTLLVIMAVGISAACGKSKKDKIIDEIKAQQNETVALQREVVNMINDAIASGLTIDENFIAQINTNSAQIDAASESINNGDFEKYSEEELSVTLDVMKTAYGDLEATKQNLQTLIDNAYGDYE